MAARRVDLSVDMLDPGDDTPAALERRSAESGVRGAPLRRERIFFVLQNVRFRDPIYDVYPRFFVFFREEQY